MKRLYFAPLALLLSAAAPVPTPTSALTPATDGPNERAAQQVEALERQRFAAQVSKDYAFLERAFADDLVYTHSNGHQNTKAEYLQSIRDGKSQYEQIVVEALRVRAYHGGTTAVVNGTILITLPNKPDGSPNLAHLQYVVVQIKDRRKGWQVVLWQSQKQAT